MLEGVLLFRQGDYDQSAEFAIRAVRLLHNCDGGPSYTKTSHVKWITRPLFYARQKTALNEWIIQIPHNATTMISERLRQGCARLLALRMERTDGADAGTALHEEARNIAALSSQMRGYWDEVYEIGRALMLAGDWEELDHLPVERMQALPFESALFAADREINLLRRKLELPPWDGDLDWPPAAPLAEKDIPDIGLEVGKIKSAFARLHEEAMRENQRMETNICSVATNRRVEQIATLLPWIDFGRF
jgi:hypothetical protein